MDQRSNNNLPNYGVGLEWTETLERPFLQNIDKFDCFEFIPENFMYDQGKGFLKSVKESGVPVVIHGVELSFGTAEPLKEKHLEQVLRVADQVNTVIFSEHLAMTEVGGVEIGQLTPVPWTMESADAVCRNIDRIQKISPYPFMIENITNRFLIPFTELSETEFINLLLRRTGCGLLLDLNNVHTNATNFNFDPYRWLEEIDLDRVMGIHLAGGEYDSDGVLLDSHNATVPEAVWNLYQFVCERTNPNATIVERTGNIPEFEKLTAEVRRAQEILGNSEIRRLSQPLANQVSGGAL